MRWKSLLAIILVILFAFVMVGCGKSESQSSAEPEEQSVDAQFIADLGKALEARWDITDKSPTYTVEKEKQTYNKAIEAEMSYLASYETAEFEDSELQTKAVEYINCLKGQQSALEYIAVDYTKYMDDWEKAYNARAKLIKDFAENYGLTVSANKSDALKSLIEDADQVIANETE